jgi:mRNA-degrading endonuclease toxin of MazEF toxin-antitoxin module
LETLVRGLRTVHDNETAPLPQAERERVSSSWTSGSQWALSARLDPERGEMVRSALAAVAKAEALSATDALVRLAEIGLAALADGRARSLSGEEQAAVVVHVDAARIQEPEPADDAAMPVARSAERGRVLAMGRIADGPGLPPAVVERLACIGRVRLAIRDGDQPGRSRRLVTPRQCQALKIRDGDCCAYPGCRNKRGLEAHHVQHWLHGGRTDLDNLILLCEMHHQAHHHGEFAIQRLGRGRFRFWRGGRELPAWIDPSALSTDPGPIEAEQDHVVATAATPRPALIVQDDRFGTDSVTVCPFTADPTEAPLIRLKIEAGKPVGLTGTSRLMIDKLTTVQRRRLGAKVGDLDHTTMLRVNRAIIVFLGLAGGRTS